MQQQLEDIEMQIWQYLDGTCTETDKLRIGQLIGTNEIWRIRYTELFALQKRLQGMETDHPSMRFTANVMDAIATAHVAGTTARYINNRIVKGIAAFYLLLIVSAIIIFLVVALNAPAADGPGNFLFRKYFNNDVLKAIMFINIILALMLTDKLIRRRTQRKISM